MAFDRTGFAQWLASQGLVTAPTAYPKVLDRIEALGTLSIDHLVPRHMPELRAMLQLPGTGPFKGLARNALGTFRSCIRSYHDYLLQRSLN